MGVLNQKEVDYKSKFERIMRIREGKMSEKEKEDLIKEEQIY